ncbi:MAG TPA: hypothetical protein VMU39_29250, partial [Solirubrobacteraceae bacterium]|nr:hypothetical protein [Solirubrobacteraceae bacterium]
MPLLPVVLIVAALALGAGLIGLGSATGPVVSTTSVTVLPREPRGRAIPASFLGLSLEYPALIAYAGTDPNAINPAFVSLIRQLDPSGRPVLRIGGDSADWTWWPVRGATRPRGVGYALSPRWLAVASALVRAVHAKLILGLNLEAGSPALAAAEAAALSGGLPAGSVSAFQLGNEPELYGLFAWYRTAGGRAVPGRPHDYGFAAYLRDATTLTAALPGLALSGPSTGGLGWRADLGRYLAAEPQVKLVTVHRYPLQLCYVSHKASRYPTVPNLLAARSSTGLADTFRGEVALAHARGLRLRVDELNTVSCGADREVSQSFASALWALDTLFELARVGVDGVNVHTFPGAGYELFAFAHGHGGWRETIAPEFYGLRMFADAAPPGSRLVPVAGVPRDGSLKVWATAAADGSVRVALIDKSRSTARIVAVRIDRATGSATLERLTAPSVNATRGVALRRSVVTPSGGAYRVT